jgi:hypothetical protein
MHNGTKVHHRCAVRYIIRVFTFPFKFTISDSPSFNLTTTLLLKWIIRLLLWYVILNNLSALISLLPISTTLDSTSVPLLREKCRKRLTVGTVVARDVNESVVYGRVCCVGLESEVCVQAVCSMLVRLGGIWLHWWWRFFAFNLLYKGIV